MVSNGTRLTKQVLLTSIKNGVYWPLTLKLLFLRGSFSSEKGYNSGNSYTSKISSCAVALNVVSVVAMFTEQATTTAFEKLNNNSHAVTLERKPLFLSLPLLLAWAKAPGRAPGNEANLA